MTAKFWRFAAACLIVLGFLIAFARCAFADDCRRIEDEQAEATANGYFVVKDYAGAAAKAFVPIFNGLTPPQLGDIDADRLRVFGREDLAFVIISFLDQGCLVARLRVPIPIYRQVDLETARHLADEDSAS